MHKSQFLYTLTNICCFLVCLFVFNYSHPNVHVKGIMVLIYIFLVMSNVEHLFCGLVCHLYIFLGEKSIQVLCPFSNWVVWVFCGWMCKFWVLETMDRGACGLQSIWSQKSQTRLSYWTRTTDYVIGTKWHQWCFKVFRGVSHPWWKPLD